MFSQRSHSPCVYACVFIHCNLYWIPKRFCDGGGIRSDGQKSHRMEVSNSGFLEMVHVLEMLRWHTSVTVQPRRGSASSAD
jgi:hypothetical protein